MENHAVCDVSGVTIFERVREFNVPYRIPGFFYINTAIVGPAESVA